MPDTRTLNEQRMSSIEIHSRRNMAKNCNLNKLLVRNNKSKQAHESNSKEL